MAGNKTLNKAKEAQQDENHTRLEDISAELKQGGCGYSYGRL